MRQVFTEPFARLKSPLKVLAGSKGEDQAPLKYRAFINTIAKEGSRGGEAISGIRPWVFSLTQALSVAAAVGLAKSRVRVSASKLVWFKARKSGSGSRRGADQMEFAIWNST